ncbi:MAG TPA: molecular chaperone DnaJ [Novosphingobium sp.]|nr:molecular chaperone DnaJ [Novosphingobium sp.]
MGKLIVLLVLIAFWCRWLAGRWPWEIWQIRRVDSTGDAPRRRERPAPPPAPPSDSVSRARVLLGVGTGAGRRDILDAHRRLMLTVHPDKGGSPALVHEANDARDLLLADLGARNRG